MFRRLPTYFPNFPLKLIPLTEAQQKIYEKTGFLRELAFRTIPSVNKVRSWARVQAVGVSLPREVPLEDHHPGCMPCCYRRQKLAPRLGIMENPCVLSRRLRSKASWRKFMV